MEECGYPFHLTFFFVCEGARSGAGAAKETRGPTVTGVSTGENDLSRDDSEQQLNSISSVLPTMWLGAQSGW